MEDDSYTGTRDGHLETGARAGAGRDAGHGLDTVRVQVRVVQQQVGSTQRQRLVQREKSKLMFFHYLSITPGSMSRLQLFVARVSVDTGTASPCSYVSL